MIFKSTDKPINDKPTLSWKGSSRMKCEKCGANTFLPFKCPYCGHYFCSDHRLPENHNCTEIETARTERGQGPVVTQKQRSYEYTVTYPAQTVMKRKIQFSNKEIGHLAVAAALVTGVGLSYVGLPVLLPGRYSLDYAVLSLSIAIFAVSFLVHEMAHKVVAQRLGCWAEFRLNALGAILTLLSIFPTFFKVISPGAVMISGLGDRKGIGKISIAGPLTNIIFSVAFLGTSFLASDYVAVFRSGAALNAWMAVFNLIPFGIFDGFKIYFWNKKLWMLAFAASVTLAAVSLLLIY